MQRVTRGECATCEGVRKREGERETARCVPEENNSKFLICCARFLCWRAEIFNCRFNGEWPNGFWLPPAALFTSLLPLFVNASKVPVVAFIVVVLVLRLPFAHIKNTFSLLCHLFSHTTSVDREEGRAGTRGGGETLQDVLELVAF